MDVRDGAKVAATTAAAQRLVAEGFVPEDMGDDTMYRFSRGPAIVDVLAPDHLAAWTPITTLPPRLALATIGRFVADGAVAVVSSLEEIRDQSCQRLTQPSMGTLVKMHAIGRVSGSELAGIEERRVGLARELLVVARELP